MKRNCCESVCFTVCQMEDRPRPNSSAPCNIKGTHAEITGKTEFASKNYLCVLSLGVSASHQAITFFFLHFAFFLLSFSPFFCVESFHPFPWCCSCTLWLEWLVWLAWYYGGVCVTPGRKQGATRQSLPQVLVQTQAATAERASRSAPLWLLYRQRRGW